MNTVPTTPLPDWQRERLALLLDALDGVPITDAEQRSLTWLSGWELRTRTSPPDWPSCRRSHWPSTTAPWTTGRTGQLGRSSSSLPPRRRPMLTWGTPTSECKRPSAATRRPCAQAI